MYRLLKFTRLYRLYLYFFRYNIFLQFEKELIFYKSLNINENEAIFDIGSNIGNKSKLFSRVSKKVISVEPDNWNQKILKWRFLLNKNVVLINSAVGNKIGISKFYINEPGSPANTLSIKWRKILENADKNRWSKTLSFDTYYYVNIRTLDDLIEEFGKPYYIKIDIEGYEYQAIDGLSYKIPVISLEANFPEFKNEIIGCVEKLFLINKNIQFNCINSDYKFFWSENKDYLDIKKWLNLTDMKYFELFCFNLKNILSV